MKRSEKFLDKAKSVPYTNEELKLLQDLISGYCDPGEDLPFDLWNGLMFAIEEYIRYGGISVNMSSDTILGYESDNCKHLNFMQYLLVYYRKIFLFLTCVDMNHVALYLKKNPFNIFCEWRYKINQ